MSANNLEVIKIEENDIRNNLYNPQYATHAMSTDPYFNLVKITEEVWNSICTAIFQIKEDKTLYFPEARMHLRKKISRSWKDIQKLAKNNNIENYFGDNANHVFIAGGRALGTLLTVSYSDTDYFTTKEIQPWEIKNTSTKFKITPHVINFDSNKQLIKRLYKAPHEIVHSFDIDCCSVLINKNGEIYGSKRFIYSLVNGYNTIDFNYFSPSYEWRLIKYSNRGFSVYVPYVLNCEDPESLYKQNINGTCVPDSIWSFADIDDLLNGSFLKSILMNAKGLQKILIASSVAISGNRSEFEQKQEQVTTFSSHTSEVFSSNGLTKYSSHRLSKISSKQLSDYEDTSEPTDAISGKINIGDDFFYLNGFIGYDENGVPNSYKGNLETLVPQNIRQFSSNLTTKLLNIFTSPYRKVNPGEQTTSTFHRIVLDDPNEWYKLEKSELFEKSLYTLLYFRKISLPPSLYDEKVIWFGPEAANLFVYHFARLYLNNRIYSKFNNLEVTNIRISYGEIRPKSIIYNNDEFIIPRGDSKGIFETLLSITSKYNILTNKELDILTSLYIRTKEGIIPRIEPHHGKP